MRIAHILTQNLSDSYGYPDLEFLVTGYMDLYAGTLGLWRLTTFLEAAMYSSKDLESSEVQSQDLTR